MPEMKLLSLEETAQVLRLSAASVRRLVELGDLEGTLTPEGLYVEASVLAEFVGRPFRTSVRRPGWPDRSSPRDRDSRTA